MKNEKSSSLGSPSEKENGGFRAKATEYKHIIDVYMMSVSFIQESNVKLKRFAF